MGGATRIACVTTCVTIPDKTITYGLDSIRLVLVPVGDGLL